MLTLMYACEANKALSELHLLRQFLVHIYFNKFFHHQYVPYSLYNQRRGTSLSFKSTEGQRTVHTQPSYSFVARQQTSIIAPKPVTF